MWNNNTADETNVLLINGSLSRKYVYFYTHFFTLVFDLSSVDLIVKLKT